MPLLLCLTTLIPPLFLKSGQLHNDHGVIPPENELRHPSSIGPPLPVLAAILSHNTVPTNRSVHSLSTSHPKHPEGQGSVFFIFISPLQPAHGRPPITAY